MPGPWYFAWAGGSIQEQVSVITNGNTHGGTSQTMAFVGDAHGNQIVNLASTSNFEQGTLYRLDGSGVPDGTYFIYDSGVLSGLPGSINLTQSIGGGLSQTFVATKSVPVGSVPGSIMQNSNVVVLGDIDLPAGIYAIVGTGIAQTQQTTSSHDEFGDHSSNTETVLIGSAYFNYDGSSGSAQLKYLVADIDITNGIDLGTGQPTTITTYNVSEKNATATTSGQFAMLITGMPDTDWYSITSMPDGVLSSLTAGLRYNINGNGLQVGTTFIAPGGGNAIEIDQAATSAQVNAILTITGPRTPDSAFDPTIHDRFDVDVLDVEIAQDEGSFATLTIHLRLRNPTLGLLAIGGNLWCWLSWDQAWTPAETATPDLVPLFNGRLVGVPKLQANEIVELEFLARPDDYSAQKTALANALSVLPYYDPVWLAANVNPDTVLETYSALFHVDRVSLGVSVSDILQGEDGTVAIGEDTAFYENFSLSYDQPPLVSVSVSGTVGWQQEADGFLDVTSAVVQAFHSQGSPWGGTFPSGGASALSPYWTWGNRGYVSGGGMISCLCGDGLKSDWPKPGTSIGGGWSLSTLNDGSGVPLNYIIDAVKPQGWYAQLDYTLLVTSQVAGPTTIDGATSDVGQYFNPYGTYSIGFPYNIYKIRMTLQYKANRRRTETIAAVLTADVQRLLSDSSENDNETVELTSEYVNQGVDPGGQIPIGNLASRSYFQTDRGSYSFEYLLLSARAKLRARARAVNITFGTDWQTALGITLRKSVLLTDRRLPGGNATGKVKSYRLTFSGGRMMGEFTIGCAIGNGNPAEAVTGTNSYVDDPYVDPGYQVVARSQIGLLSDELYYETLDDFAIDDDGLDLNNMSVASALNECFVTNGLTAQVNAVKPYAGLVLGGASLGDPLNVMRTLKTTVTLDMKPVEGSEFHTSFFPAVSELALPMTIDLSASDEGGERFRAAVAGGYTRWDYGRGVSVWDGGATVWDPT